MGYLLTLKELNQAVRQLKGGIGQIELVKRFSVFQTFNNRLWSSIKETGNTVEQHPGCRRCSGLIFDINW